MKILIVDDHVLFREGLVSLLSNQPDLSVVGEAGSVEQAVDLALTLEPDLVLMDINLPDGSGLDAVRDILRQRPDMKIVMLTIHESDDLLFSAISIGAKGFLLKNMPVTKLVSAIRALERGEAALSRTMTSRILDKFSDMAAMVDFTSSDEQEAITPRELEVLKLLAVGADNTQISKSLFLTENTVKVHIHNILKKLNLHNRREAANYAIRKGLVKPPSGFDLKGKE